MTGLITILGGSGFVGRYIARRMAKAGWRVRVATRRPNEAMFVRTYGVVGQVEPMLCNIRDDASVRAAVEGADAVVNCVGILNETGKNRFASVQVEGAQRVARMAAEAGALHFVQISAIGADAASESAYARTKAAGEEAVRKGFPGAVILRPSIIFGPEDQFFNRFARMARFSPFLPIAGGKTRFQPVYVDDVAKAASLAAQGGAEPGIYELGGPDVRSFRELMEILLGQIRRKRVIVTLPWFAARFAAWAFDLLQTVSVGLFTNNQLTRDQLKQLRRDNVVSEDAKGFAELGIAPVPMELILPGYLWPYRPIGQYEDIRDSAGNLRRQE
ncbi:complex I NDUFA9 subunit family protein [Pararhodobacter sp. SW119]|uniref:complex I NDUFA9 subunit family protein n=1 Tax=Pararhodobacter sp. SW119 TaxID=2780075 RepID=UPI001ADEDBBA|nr:complex I NDUFA9 subunit family protein [Pararhodobacter sp. SW119]